MDIPILGQHAQVLFWYPTVNIWCKCRGDNVLNLLVITGINNISTCGQCKKGYKVTGYRQDQVEGGIVINPIVETILAGPERIM